MKRIFALLLGAAMLLSFAACGGSDEPAPTDAAVPTTVPATEMTNAPTEAPTQPTESQNLLGNTIMLLVDNEDVRVYITKIENNEHTGMQLHIQCENMTDRALLFSWDMVSVCGFMYDPLWSEEVAGGKTSNSTIYLDTFELEQMGITSVDEISFTLRVVDSENWMEAPLVQEACTIYPTGLTAETVQLPDRAPTDGQTVIADDDNLRFVIEWASEEDPTTYTLFVYVENKADRNLMYSWEMVSVNSQMVDTFWSTSVTAGNKACSEVVFSRSELEGKGITEISEIEFTLIVSDYDDWEADCLLEETYTYQP